MRDYEEQRDQMVKDRVAELMHGNPNPKDDYSLSLPANLDEFMQECSEQVRGDLLTVLHNYSHTNSAKSFEQLGRVFYCGFSEYMETLALSRAERETPSAAEMRDNDEAAAADHRAQVRRDNLLEAYRHAA